MVPQSNSKYYRIDVVMKTGFKYSICCMGKQLNGMKESSNTFWTESMHVSEVTPEEYENFYTDKEMATDAAPEKISKKSRKLITFSNIEDFLEGNTKSKKKKL